MSRPPLGTMGARKPDDVLCTNSNGKLVDHIIYSYRCSVCNRPETTTFHALERTHCCRHCERGHAVWEKICADDERKRQLQEAREATHEQPPPRDFLCRTQDGNAAFPCAPFFVGNSGARNAKEHAVKEAQNLHAKRTKKENVVW